MSDPAPSDSIGLEISGLIDSFFSAVRASLDLQGQEARTAELIYELDQVVSSYLDDEGLSSDAFQLIQQDVLNNIAQDLIDHLGEASDIDVSFDADGNADPVEVIAAIDDYFDILFSPDSLGDGGSVPMG